MQVPGRRLWAHDFHHSGNHNFSCNVTAKSGEARKSRTSAVMITFTVTFMSSDIFIKPSSLSRNLQSCEREPNTWQKTSKSMWFVMRGSEWQRWRFVSPKITIGLYIISQFSCGSLFLSPHFEWGWSQRLCSYDLTTAYIHLSLQRSPLCAGKPGRSIARMVK